MFAHISKATLYFFCNHLLRLWLEWITQAHLNAMSTFCCFTAVHRLMPSSPKGSNHRVLVGCTSKDSKPATFWRNNHQIWSNNKPGLWGVTHFKNHILCSPVDRRRDLCRSLAHQQQFSIWARRYKTIASAPGCKVNDSQKSMWAEDKGESGAVQSSERDWRELLSQFLSVQNFQSLWSLLVFSS